MSNTTTSQNLDWNIDTDYGKVLTPNQSVVQENKQVKKVLLPDGTYNGTLVQIYKREFASQTGATFTKYMYEVMIGNKIVKGNTYAKYLEQDMKNLGIVSIHQLLGQQVRALITTANIVDPETKADIKFNKIMRLWLTQPAPK